MRIKNLLVVALACTTLLTYAQQWGWATLIAPQNSTTVTLLDTNSNVIKTWTGLTGQTGYSNYLMPGGILWRSVKTTNNSFSGGGLHGRIQKVDWNGTILFDYTISDANQIAHHDFCPMPNGDVLVIVYDKKTGTQMQAAGATSTSARQLEKIVQLHPTGTTTATIAWQWNLYDHLCQNSNSGGANYVSSIQNNPQLMNVNYQVNNDWWHMNGIDYNAALDQIAISSHNMNEHYIIDHSTTTAEAATHTGGTHNKGGDFLYRWGNPKAYGFTTATTNFNVTHDAHWIPADCPKAGWLVGMNNKGVSNSQSSIDMWQSTWNGSTYTLTVGQQYLPATYGYRHACQNQGGAGAGYTSNMGNSQQLPNGNMLVCLATAGDVYEIDSNGNQLWFYSLASGSLAHAYRYSKCFIENPSAAITNVSPAVCANSSTPLVLNATATATNVTNYTYAWSPATGLSSTTVANPSVTNITSPTTYTVTIHTGSCTASASVTVNINSTPVADAGNSVTIATGSTTPLTATGGTGYLWSTGETTASINVSPNTTTTYSVTVTNASGCTAADQVTVFVSGGNLTVGVSATDESFCAGGSTLVTATASGGSGTYTYLWSTGDNTAGITVNPSSDITYTVTVSDGSATASGDINITVFPTPAVFAGNDVSIVSGNSTTLTATGTTTYQWSNGVNTASQTVSPVVTTTYIVTGTDPNGCTATDDVVVSVTGGPLSVAVSASDSTICNGESAQLFAIASGGSGTYTYAWSSIPAGFSSGLYNPYINPSSATAYLVTVSDGNTSATGNLMINVLALPAQPIITPNDTLLVSSSAVNNQWFYYGNPVAGGTNQVLAPTLVGSYQVQVIDSNGCASPLSDPYEYLLSGVEDLSRQAGFLLYPNPAHGRVTVVGKFSDTYHLAVLDETGRVVLAVQNNPVLPVESLSAGVYVVAITSGAATTYKRLLVVQ